MIDIVDIEQFDDYYIKVNCSNGMWFLVPRGYTREDAEDILIEHNIDLREIHFNKEPEYKR